MPSKFTQEGRLGQLFTPLGDDTLVLLGFEGTEHVNDMNEFSATALSETGKVDLNQLIGQHMQIDIQSSPTVVRSFDFICTGATTLSYNENSAVYEFELRPWLWALGMRTNSRIFHKMKVVDIVRQVCADYGSLGGGNIDDKTGGNFPELEYVVQFQETDLNFVRRLLEENGINFHIKMASGSHSLVLTMSADDFDDAETSPKYNPGANTNLHEIDSISNWRGRKGITTNAVKITDYNFKTPKVGMQSEQGGDALKLEYYEYPGRFTESSTGRDLAKKRLDGLKSKASLVQAEGNIPAIGAGTCFTLSGHPDSGCNVKHAVLSANHRLMNIDYRTGGGGDSQYFGQYVLTKATHPVAPEIKTQKLQMRGPQTAVVVDGADGNTDEFGRIIVQFYWDLSGQSMPCRVAQTWAGPQWGAVFIPHTGMEVIVEFINGDPDHPMVIGCVYNASNMPPWDLPGEKAKSGIKTVRDNEFSIDDKSGSEKIQIDARKDMDIHVTEESTIRVDGNETTTVIKTMTLESKEKIILKVGGSKITMDSSSITLEATNIELKAAMSMKTNGGGTAEHTASGQMTIQAPLVKIN